SGRCPQVLGLSLELDAWQRRPRRRPNRLPAPPRPVRSREEAGGGRSGEAVARSPAGVRAWVSRSHRAPDGRRFAAPLPGSRLDLRNRKIRSKLADAAVESPADRGV